MFFFIALSSKAQSIKIERVPTKYNYEFKYGIKDTIENKWLLKPEYDKIINENGTYIIYTFSRNPHEMTLIGFCSTTGIYTGQVYNSYKGIYSHSKLKYYIVEVFKYKNGVSRGIVDTRGNERITPGKYNLKEINQNGYIIFSTSGTKIKTINDSALINEKFGIIYYDGTIILEPEYDAIISIGNDFKNFERELDVYLINKGGKWEFSKKLQYPEISGGKWGVLNSNGKIIIPVTYEHIDLFPDPNYPYIFKVNRGGEENIYQIGKRKNGKEWKPYYGRSVKGGYYGYADTTGKEIVPAIFTWISNYEHEKSKVFLVAKDPVRFNKRPRRLALSDLDGKILTPFKYSEFIDSEFSNSGISDSIVIAAITPTLRWNRFIYGFLRVDGKEMTPFNMNFHISKDHIGYYSKDKCAIYSKRDSKGHKFYSLMRPDFSFSHPRYDELKFVSPGFAARIKNSWSLLDNYGNPLTPFKFEKLIAWDNNTVLVTLKGKKNLLDFSGKELFTEWIDMNEIITPNLSAIVKRNGKYGILAFLGDTLVPFEFDYFVPVDSVLEGYSYREDWKALMNNGFSKMSYNPFLTYTYFVNKGGKEVKGKVIGGKWGFINPETDSLIIPAVYDRLEAIVLRGHNKNVSWIVFRYMNGGKVGFIDMNNRKIEIRY